MGMEEHGFGDRLGLHRFGSAGLAALISEQKEKLVLHLHGHCHDGAFLDRVAGENGMPVCNPGSLNQSEYGVLSLIKEGS